MYRVLVKVVFYGQEPPSGESTTTECGVNYQLLAVISDVAQWGSPSCSAPQPANTMASETVDPIDWSHPHPHGQYALSASCIYSINRCSSATAGIRSCNLATFSMRGNYLAYAATQGIGIVYM